MNRSQELAAMPTEDLMVAYHNALLDSTPTNRILAMERELHRRQQQHPEAYEIYQELYRSIDTVTGTKLTPSWHGEKCLGNGEHGECCCEECDSWPQCFPDWQPGSYWEKTAQRFV